LLVDVFESRSLTKFCFDRFGCEKKYNVTKEKIFADAYLFKMTTCGNMTFRKKWINYLYITTKLSKSNLKLFASNINNLYATCVTACLSTLQKSFIHHLSRGLSMKHDTDV